MVFEVYAAKVVEHVDDYDDLIQRECEIHSFRPIAKGRVRIAGVERFCLGSSDPIGEVDVPESSSTSVEETTFGPDSEIVTTPQGYRFSASQAACFVRNPESSVYPLSGRWDFPTRSFMGTKR